MRFEWIASDAVIDGPNYINSEPFLVPNAFSTFEIAKKVITPALQMEWFNRCKDFEDVRDFGWVMMVTGKDISRCRLFAYRLLAKYATKGHKVQWVRIDGRRFSTEAAPKARVFVLDSLLVFKNNESFTMDPIRTGNVFDFVSKHSGKSSVIVLAPGLTPQEACLYSHLHPDIMLNFGRDMDIEL